jgi:hypothetical protein
MSTTARNSMGGLARHNAGKQETLSLTSLLKQPRNGWPSVR